MFETEAVLENAVLCLGGVLHSSLCQRVLGTLLSGLTRVGIYLSLGAENKHADSRAWQKARRAANAISLLPAFTHSHPKNPEA